MSAKHIAATERAGKDRSVGATRSNLGAIIDIHQGDLIEPDVHRSAIRGGDGRGWRQQSQRLAFRPGAERTCLDKRGRSLGQRRLFNQLVDADEARGDDELVLRIELQSGW